MNSQNSKRKAEAGVDSVSHTAVLERSQSCKHIPLSSDRPAATDIRKAFSTLESGRLKYQIKRFPLANNLTLKALSILEEYSRLDEGRRELKRFFRSENRVSKRSDIVENRTAVIGSTDEIYSESNTGFFETVLMAYNNHYNLRTSPEDWWYCVIRRVALAIDNNSSKESVRKMFVDHQGKETLTVKVHEWPLSKVNYTTFFDKISEQIADNVKVPEYVEVMTANFSCTTSVQRIVSQITLMSSMQEVFEYEMEYFCGIPAIEMLGIEVDWEKLLTDLNTLKLVLQPIMSDIGLTERWWFLAEEIFSKLLETYRGTPDKEWWTHIITYNDNYGYGLQLPPDYSGWIVEFLEGRVGLDKYEFTSGLVTVPLQVVDAMKGVEDTAALVAGMVGMIVDEQTANNRPSVQPFQGWALMLPPNSPLTV